MPTPEFKTEVDEAADEMRQAILDQINVRREAQGVSIPMLVIACILCLLLGFIAGHIQ